MTHAIQLKFDLPLGKRLAETGMQIASDNAESKEPGWNKQCFELLKSFLEFRTKPFLCEDFRKYCELMDLTTPPSKRAFGGTIAKAAHQNLIKRIGFANVKNPRAHATPATLWIKI